MLNLRGELEASFGLSWSFVTALLIHVCEHYSSWFRCDNPRFTPEFLSSSTPRAVGSLCARLSVTRAVGIELGSATPEGSASQHRLSSSPAWASWHIFTGEAPAGTLSGAALHVYRRCDGRAG